MPLDPALTLLFVFAAGATVVSPGPDTMLILRYAVTGGRQVGLATVAGVQLGLVVHTAAAALGLSLIIASSPLLFRIVAVLGALYLAWLAVQSVRAGFLKLGGAAPAVSPRKAARDAMLTNLLNPKVIVLYLALMPQFVDLGRGRVPLQLILLGLLLIVINTAWQVPLALAAEWMRRMLDRPAVQRGVNWATGAILMTFAVLMLLEHVL